VRIDRAWMKTSVSFVFIFFLTLSNMISSDPIFVDASGNHYLVRDVAGAGDCALLALLISPSFEAPVSGADELRRAIVSFARGEARDDCPRVFA
jgi:hypothetical protein